MTQFFKTYWAPILFIVILFLVAFKLQNWARKSTNHQNNKSADRKRAESKTQTQPKVFSTQDAGNFLKKAEENGDRQLLFRIYRETKDDKIRCAAYEDLIRSEKQVSFGGMEWIVLDQLADRQLLLRKYALKDFQFGEAAFKHIHYEGEGYYYTMTCSWELSLVRRYLNTEFYSNFSAEEQNRIIPVNNDHVFLLSLEEYEKYAKTGIVVKAAFSEDKISRTCWSRSAKGWEVNHGEWKTAFYTFKSVKDLEKVPSNMNPRSISDIGVEEFDRIFSIRPAVWVRLS